MIALFALALITTDPGPLLGGPEDVQSAPRSGAVVSAYEEQSYRAEGAYQRVRHGNATTDWSADRVTARPTRPLQAGDPVQLDDGFFYGPLTGGVGGEPPRLIVVRQHNHTHNRWR